MDGGCCIKCTITNKKNPRDGLTPRNNMRNKYITIIHNLGDLLIYLEKLYLTDNTQIRMTLLLPA